MEETKDINNTAEEAKTAEKKKKSAKQAEIDALKTEIEALKAEIKEKDDKHLRRGLTTIEGKLTLLETAEKLDLPYTDANELAKEW